jgi:nucleoside-diphosphate-sugar epimerase
MKILVTGATGYIGEHLVRHAISQHHEIFSASRRRPNEPIEWLPFDLSSDSDIQLPVGIDVVIHLAATTTSGGIESDMELGAAKRLITASEQVGARLVFVSSQTARENAPTAYGRGKWQIERIILAAGGRVVRPGLVYGGTERGLFGSLVAAVRALPVIPAFLPSPKVQPIHVDDLVAALLNCAGSAGMPPSVLSVGASEPVSFTKFLQAISEGWVRRNRLSLPVPVAIVRLISSAVGSRLRARLSLDRLTSLFDLPLMTTERDLRSLGVILRPLSSGMTRTGDDRRRSLIREGKAFTSYALKAKPGSVLVRRYVRCIETLRGGQSLRIPELILNVPISIALLDDPSLLSKSQANELSWRLNSAVVLAEASVQGAHRVLAIGKSSRFVMALAHMSKAVAAEVCWRLFGIFARPFVGNVLRKSARSR